MTRGHQQNKYACQSQYDQRGQEERQGVIALRILVVQEVTLRDNLDRSVEQPAVNGVLEKAENKQTEQDGQKHFAGMDIMAPQAFKDQPDT